MMMAVVLQYMTIQNLESMIDYSGPEYENLYQEILIDSTFTYGKFSPIPYPTFMDTFRASRIEGAARQKNKRIWG